MATIVQIPEALQQTLSWKTDIIRAYDGSEQRIAIRQNPRQSFDATYLAEKDIDIQFWKYEFTFSNTSFSWNMPLWGEVLPVTAAVSATDTNIDCDFSLTDTVLGQVAMLLHPDGSNEVVLCNTGTRTDTQIALSSGAVLGNYPIGSLWIPLDAVFIRKNPNYREGVYATAQVKFAADSQTHKVIDGYGATPITLYSARPVLDMVPEFIGSNEVFAQEISRTDYGGKVRVTSGEISAHSTIGRRYIYRSNADRQWWKLFLSTVRGQQKSFYTSTHRQDMTLISQPVQGATTMLVEDAAEVADGWESVDGHTDLALSTADGDTQYVAIDTVGTVDNGDGTHTVSFTPALTNTPLGSTINKVSFLELVRLASDDVVIDYMQTANTLALSTRAVKV